MSYDLVNQTNLLISHNSVGLGDSSLKIKLWFFWSNSIKSLIGSLTDLVKTASEHLHAWNIFPGQWTSKIKIRKVLEFRKKKIQISSLFSSDSGKCLVQEITLICFVDGVKLFLGVFFFLSISRSLCVYNNSL